MITIGSQIPEMEFEIYHKEEITKVSFDDFAGQWLILFFYPANFTFVCPTELEELVRMYDQFKELSAEIISVSTDTAFAHKAWHDTSEAIKNLAFPMAADPTGKLCRTFGTYIEDEGVSLRGTFVINPQGVLKTIEIHDNGIGRNAQELLRKLQAAQFVEKHGDQVCPASWAPGSKTLKPGVDLVGKI